MLPNRALLASGSELGSGNPLTNHDRMTRPRATLHMYEPDDPTMTCEDVTAVRGYRSDDSQTFRSVSNVPRSGAVSKRNTAYH
jgi:hypothetical protein